MFACNVKTWWGPVSLRLDLSCIQTVTRDSNIFRLVVFIKSVRLDEACFTLPPLLFVLNLWVFSIYFSSGVLNLSFKLLQLASHLLKTLTFQHFGWTCLLWKKAVAFRWGPDFQFSLILCTIQRPTCAQFHAALPHTRTYLPAITAESGEGGGHLTDIAEEFKHDWLYDHFKPPTSLYAFKTCQKFPARQVAQKRGTERWKAAGNSFHFKAHLLPDTHPPNPQWHF